jgi:predicted Zn-dependent peptidase
LALDTLTSPQVTEILRRGLIEHNAGFDVVINDTKTSELYKFSAEQHPAVAYIAMGYSIVLKGNGKSSRMVYFVDADGEVYDCGLRLRVTSNNGINAFLGTSKANRNSQVVIKLQQDKVKQLLQQIGAEVTTY